MKEKHLLGVLYIQTLINGFLLGCYVVLNLL